MIDFDRWPWVSCIAVALGVAPEAAGGAASRVVDSIPVKWTWSSSSPPLPLPLILLRKEENAMVRKGLLIVGLMSGAHQLRKVREKKNLAMFDFWNSGLFSVFSA